MNYQKHLHELQKQIITDLCAIKVRPDGWLPHLVYVEEEGEDATGVGIPIYTRYRLEDFNKYGYCTLLNPNTGERFSDRHLSEINIDWLVTIWNWYNELRSEQNIK